MSHTLLIIGLVWYCLFGFRILLRTVLSDLTTLQWEDIIMGSIVAAMLCITWPAVVLGYFLKTHVGKNDPRRFAKIVAGRTPQQKVEDREAAQREKELTQRERNIAIEKQERELQLGPWRDDA